MLLYIISAVIIIGIAVYVIALHKGKIKDEDKDFIPDSFEIKATQVKDDIKHRVKRVKEEISDVKAAAKELADQIDDIPKAAGKRKGRKPKK
jgi:hypothetical protein